MMGIKTNHKKISPEMQRMLLFAYALFLLCLNTARIFDNNFWGDEGYSVLLARMDFVSMLKETASDVHPPLYYALLMIMSRVFGDAGWVYHITSLIPFAVLLIFSVTVLFKKTGALPAALFMTVAGLSENALTYNVEVRMYSLAQLFVLLSFYSFYKLLSDEKNAVPFFIVSSLCAAYSHYYALVSVAVFYAALLILTALKKFNLKNLIIIYACTVLGYLPWLAAMLSTIKRNSEGYWMNEIPGVKDIIKYLYASDQKIYSYGMVFLSVVSVIIFISTNKQTEDKSKKIFGIWLLCGLLSVLGTIGAGVAVSIMFDTAFALRFLYPVSAVLWLCFAAALSEIPNGKKTAIVLTVVSLIVFIPHYIYIYEYDKNIGRICDETVEEISPVIHGGDRIFTNGEHLDWTLIDVYLPGTSHSMAGSISDIIEEIGKDPQTVPTYILWTEKLSDEEMTEMSDAGLRSEELIANGLLGNWVYIYRLL